jgi:hypothetical protein
VFIEIFLFSSSWLDSILFGSFASSFYLTVAVCSPWSIPCSLFVFGFESSGRIAPVSVSTCVGSEAGVLSSQPQSFTVFIFSPILSWSKLVGAASSFLASQVSSVCYWFFLPRQISVRSSSLSLEILLALRFSCGPRCQPVSPLQLRFPLARVGFSHPFPFFVGKIQFAH